MIGGLVSVNVIAVKVIISLAIVAYRVGRAAYRGLAWIVAAAE